MLQNFFNTPFKPCLSYKKVNNYTLEGKNGKAGIARVLQPLLSFFGFFFDIVQPQPVETQVKWVLVLQKEGVIGLTPVKNSFFRRVGRG